VAPFPMRLTNDLTYMIVFPKERAQQNKVRDFHAWCVREAAVTQRVIAG
jgi:hypothetical protein